MRPAPFSLSRPTTISGVLVAMRAGAIPLAGGQSLLQAMRLRQQEPKALVDLSIVADLSNRIEVKLESILIGARVTHREFAEHALIESEFPWLAQAARALGDVQVRNRGTVLGNVCWADPRANMAVAMLASNATVHCIDPESDASSTLTIDEFFTGFRKHVLNGRLAVALEIPRQAGRGVYREFSRQRQDLALTNVCVVLGGAAARVVVGGVHQTPIRLAALETALSESSPAFSIAHAIVHAFDNLMLNPLQDPYGPASYKQHLAQVELTRALTSLGVTFE
jgi:carbon-monoxide dehydrogenase medium subunit